MDKNHLVTKSNKLIMSKYKLSLQEQRIILVLASMVQPEDEEFKEYEIGIKEFCDFLGVENKKAYIELPQITKELMSKVLEIKEDNKIIQLHWISTAIYKTKEGRIILKFAPELKPYLLQLKEYFTTYKLDNVLALKSSYSIRLYEILKANEFKRNFEIATDELKNILCSGFDKYNDFKRYALQVAQQELKEKTDIYFEFEEIKKGRKVEKLKFYIKKNKVEDEGKNEVTVTIEPEQEEINPLVKEVKSIMDITTKEAEKLLNAAKGDIELIKEKFQIAKQQGNINNLVAWMIKAIQEDYQEPKEVKKEVKNYFNSYGGQRKYDIKELEKMLLNRNR